MYTSLKHFIETRVCKFMSQTSERLFSHPSRPSSLPLFESRIRRILVWQRMKATAGTIRGTFWRTCVCSQPKSKRRLSTITNHVNTHVNSIILSILHTRSLHDNHVRAYHQCIRIQN